MPAKRTDFLVRSGWEPVRKHGFPVVMWRDPLLLSGRLLWPHEAEFRADMRLAVIRSVMEG